MSRERERERDRDRDRDRQRDRQTETETERQRETDRQRQRPRDRDARIKNPTERFHLLPNPSFCLQETKAMVPKVCQLYCLTVFVSD